jgi:hypothetical protein
MFFRRTGMLVRSVLCRVLVFVQIDLQVLVYQRDDLEN